MNETVIIRETLGYPATIYIMLTYIIKAWCAIKKHSVNSAGGENQ